MKKFFDRPYPSELLEQETLKRIPQVALDIQYITGISSSIDVLNVNFNAGKLEATGPYTLQYETEYQGLRGCDINLTRNTDLEGVLHEVTHAILFDDIKRLSELKYQNALGEAICDLVAIEFAYQPEEVEKIINERQGYYSQNVTSEDIDRFITHPDP